MKQVILLFAFSGILLFHLSAQTKKDKIAELFHLMKTDSIISAMLGNMANMTSVYPHNDSNVDNSRKDSLFKVYVREETTAYSKKMYDGYMVEIYDKYFTIEEIQKYIDFYKSPEGQKMLNLTPVLMKDMVAKMMKEDMPELQARLKKKLEELYN